MKLPVLPCGKSDALDLTAANLSLHRLKTGSSINIPIHDELLRHLEASADGSTNAMTGFLTPTLAKAETGGAQGLSRQFVEIRKQAGVSARKVSEGARRRQNERRFHSLRTPSSPLSQPQISLPNCA